MIILDVFYIMNLVWSKCMSSGNFPVCIGDGNDIYIVYVDNGISMLKINDKGLILSKVQLTNGNGDAVPSISYSTTNIYIVYQTYVKSQTTFGRNICNISIIKLSKNGDIIWNKSDPKINFDTENGCPKLVVVDAHIYCIYSGFVYPNSFFCCIFKLDEDGEIIWIKKRYSDRYVRPNIIKSKNGIVIVYTMSKNLVIVGYDLNGEELFVYNIFIENFISSKIENIIPVIQTDSNHIYLGFGSVLCKISYEGQVLWVFDKKAICYSPSLVLDNYGNSYMSYHLIDSLHMVILKIDKYGNIIGEYVDKKNVKLLPYIYLSSDMTKIFTVSCTYKNEIIVDHFLNKGLLPKYIGRGTFKRRNC